MFFLWTKINRFAPFEKHKVVGRKLSRNRYTYHNVYYTFYDVYNDNSYYRFLCHYFGHRRFPLEYSSNVGKSMWVLFIVLIVVSKNFFFLFTTNTMRYGVLWSALKWVLLNLHILSLLSVLIYLALTFPVIYDRNMSKFDQSVFPPLRLFNYNKKVICRFLFVNFKLVFTDVQKLNILFVVSSEWLKYRVVLWCKSTFSGWLHWWLITFTSLA